MVLTRSDESSVRGTMPNGEDADGPLSYAPGRACSFPGCDTMLSIYNPSSRCWLHEEKRAYILRVRNGKASSMAA